VLTLTKMRAVSLIASVLQSGWINAAVNNQCAARRILKKLHIKGMSTMSKSSTAISKLPHSRILNIKTSISSGTAHC
jgi:hypothetical protein